MENTEIADIFDEIADLLELRNENPFRVRSYRGAAQSVRNLGNRVEDLVRDGKDLSDIPNIGESTAEKLHEIVETGTCRRLKELRRKVPAGLPEVMRVPGVGPRTAIQLHKELKIESREDLRQACEENRVRDLEGMGEKTEQKILQGIETVAHTVGRLLRQEAAEHLESLSRHLDGLEALDRWVVAGSYRRGKDTVGDLDILVRAVARGKAGEEILEYESVSEVISRGEERISVRLKSGLQVDFRFFDAEAFGAAMLYFTGSKAHNIRIRRLAQNRDWKLNEYGIFKDDHRLAGKTEESVYRRLNMAWVPPELREDRGEVEAAQEDRLPVLVEPEDVHGDFQCHTRASDGKHTIREMARAARSYGLDYLAITDHSKRVTMANGLDDDAARKHADAIREADADLDRFWLMAGIEVDILKSGKLDLEEKTLAGMDWVVASIHYDREMSRKAMTERILSAVCSGVVHCLGHPLGRIIGKRGPIDVDMDRIVEACVEQNVWLEINCQPDRLDLPDTVCHGAREGGARFVLATDAHSSDGFRTIPLGVTVARRAWLQKEDLLNTQSLTELKKILRAR